MGIAVLSKDDVVAIATEACSQAIQTYHHTVLAKEIAFLQQSLAPPALLTREEVIALLQVHPSTLNRWEKDGTLVPIQRKGRRVYYDPSDVTAKKNK